MNVELLNNNYLFVSDFLNPEETKTLYERFKKDCYLYPFLFEKNDEQVPLSLSIYNYIPFLELLCEKTYFINKIIGEKVLPTYTYARLYKNGAVLKKHSDRPSCQVSVTLNIGGDGSSWPIWFTKPNKEIVSYDLKPGQGIIYLGCVSEHWRDAFEGEEYAQVFLHYVLGSGNYSHHYFDRIKDKS